MGVRNFLKDVIRVTDEVECFCIVPEKRDGATAEGDKSFLRLWANIPQQTHSLNVGVVERPFQSFSNTDALITFLKEVPIGVVTADCVPILLHSPDACGVAAVHAGWKGSIGGILDNVLDEMEGHGADLSKLTVIFGPSISKEVYEVDRELGERFVEAGFGEYVKWPEGMDGKPHVDLQGVNMERLLRRGVLRENIQLSDDCTYRSESLHSYRRDGDKAGRQLTAIVLR